MDEVVVQDAVMAGMPRGGPNASWLDRRLQTGALEYTRCDVADEVKQKENARTAVGVVADISHPRILPAPTTAVFSRPGATPAAGNDTAPTDWGQS
jgi:hypothetical protein